MQVQVLSCALSRNAVVCWLRRFFMRQAMLQKRFTACDFGSRKAALHLNRHALQLLAPR